MEGHICRSNVLAPIGEVHTVALLSPRVIDEHTLLCTRGQLGEAGGVILDKGSAAEHSRWEREDISSRSQSLKGNNTSKSDRWKAVHQVCSSQNIVAPEILRYPHSK